MATNQMLTMPRNRKRAIALLYAHRKAEQYEERGITALITEGIFPSDGLYEVYWRIPERDPE